MRVSDTPQSAYLREYCGWKGNIEDDIVTSGTVYRDTASKGHGERHEPRRVGRHLQSD